MKNNFFNMPSNVIEQLKELKNIKPRQDWVDSERRLLLSQITTQASAKPQSFLINSWFLVKSVMPSGAMKFVARPIGALTVFAVFIFSTGIFGVNASRGSLPGEMLYSVKLTTEKIKVGMTATNNKKAAMHVQFAEERLKEIEKIAAIPKNKEEKNAQIKVAAEGLKQEMDIAKEQMDKSKATTGDAKAVIAVVKQVDAKTEEIGNRLEQQKTAIKQESAISNTEIIKTLNEAEDSTHDAGVKAVEVMVDKHDKGEGQLSEKELMDTIEKKINKTENKVQELAVEVKDAGKIATDNNANRETAQTNIDSQTMDGLKDKPVEAQQKLTEAKDLLNQGDLVSAVAKIQETTAINKTVKEAVNNVNQEIKTEAPAVNVPVENVAPATSAPPAPAVQINNVEVK